MTGPTPLGFTWEAGALGGLRRDDSTERASFRFQAALPHAVWEAAKYEGSPYTFPEVATLLDGVTVGGHTLSDQSLILGLADAARAMLARVREGTFSLSKDISDDLNGRIAAGEGGVYAAPEHGPGGSTLVEHFSAGVEYLTHDVVDAGHQALLYFPFAALSQFYFDGNKRTARWMMNGHLLAHGYEPIGVPVEARERWHEALSALFVTADASALLNLLADCQFSRIEERALAQRERLVPPPAPRRQPNEGWGRQRWVRDNRLR